MTNYVSVAGWATDFCRALNERSRFMKWLFRKCVGRYAYREYQGLIRELEKVGMEHDFEYGLEEMSYHSDKLDDSIVGFFAKNKDKNNV